MHRFRIAERWRIVQAQIEFVLLGQGKRRDVLILCGVCGAENAGYIDDRADIRTVIAAARGWRGTDLGQQIGRGAGGQGRDHGLAVRVIEHQLIGVLREARHLLGAGLIETLLIELHIQTARQQRGVRFQLLGIGGVGFAERLRDIFPDAGDRGWLAADPARRAQTRRACRGPRCGGC